MSPSAVRLLSAIKKGLNMIRNLKPLPGPPKPNGGPTPVPPGPHVPPPN